MNIILKLRSTYHLNYLDPHIDWRIDNLSWGNITEKVANNSLNGAFNTFHCGSYFS